MDLNEARRLKELERENTEIKKMLSVAMLAKRVLECALEKIVRPGHKKENVVAAVKAEVCSGRAGMSDIEAFAVVVLALGWPADKPAAETGEADPCDVRREPPGAGLSAFT